MSEFEKETIIKDRYTLKELQGSGNFGEVWLAHDEILDCDIAIKIYISLDSHGVEEFKSEYTTTQELHHPNLLTPAYFDIWQHRPFLVMKYCARGSLSKYVGKMDEYQLWQFIHDVSAGLKYLHTQAEPIVHQDIKPDNILVDDNGHYLITDFGISKKIRSTMRKQSKRAVGAGATAYMGPERFEANPSPVKASDIWSLGASIYELATGELPFSGFGGGMQRNGAEIPTLDNKWSKDMDMVMQSCLAKETWSRPTAQQLETFSDAILRGIPAKATWALPHKIEEEPIENIEENNDNGGNGPEKKKKWVVLCTLIMCFVCAFGVYKLLTSGSQTIENDAASSANIEYLDSLERATTPQSTKHVEGTNHPTSIINPSSPTPIEQANGNISTKNVEDKKKDEPKSDDNATILKNALKNNDYQQIQKLANQGYSPAFGPLAKYYLQNRDYTSAETYAKKAQSAGFSEGTTILETLESLGYYN